MSPETVVETLQSSSRVNLTREELHELLGAATVVREEDSCISGMLRILRLANDTLLVQEETPKGEILVRRRPSLEEAEQFIRGRLEVYERMWDGCGCKVNYEDP